MMEAGITGLSLKWPCRKNSWPLILYLALAPCELTEASLRKRNGGWIGMTDAICSMGRNFVGLGSGRPAHLAFDELLDVAERAQVAQFLVVDRHLQHVFHEDDDLHHRQRIDAQILDQPQIVVGVLELGAQVGLDIPLDDAQHDGRQMLGVAGLAELARGLVGGGGAPFQGFPQICIVLGGKRFWGPAKGLLAPELVSTACAMLRCCKLWPFRL